MLSGSEKIRKTLCTLSYRDDDKEINGITTLALDTSETMFTSLSQSKYETGKADLSLEQTVFLPFHQYISKTLPTFNELHLNSMWIVLCITDFICTRWLQCP